MARKKAAIAVMAIDDGGYAEAEKKAQDPAMTTKDNPLARNNDCSYCGPNPALFSHNMDRLHTDARLRREPVNGKIYGAIMDTRYGG